MKTLENLRLGGLVNPLIDFKRPVYNWFAMKESFSSGLVRLLAETWRLEKGDVVLDSFCGAGTTPLACRELGLDCVGFDVHPVSLFASRVKLREYNIEGLKEFAGELLGSRPDPEEVDVPGFVTRVFPNRVLRDILAFRQVAEEVNDDDARDFLLLGLANAAMRCSWAHKDGAAIKVVKRPLPSFRKALKRQLFSMFTHLGEFKVKQSTIRIEHSDAREMKLTDESVDAVITSPPYLGKHEYIHAYRIEQWLLGLKGPSANNLIGFRSTDVGEDFSGVEGKIGDKSLEVNHYFKDMLAAIKELYRVCRSGCKLCLVVSDGCFRDGVVDVCVQLSKLAEIVGFKAKRVITVNSRYCTTPSRRKIGTTREALLLWVK